MTSAPPTSGIAQLKKLLGFHIAEIAIGVWGIVKIRSGLENVYGEEDKEIFWGVVLLFIAWLLAFYMRGDAHKRQIESLGWALGHKEHEIQTLRERKNKTWEELEVAKEKLAWYAALHERGESEE